MLTKITTATPSLNKLSPLILVSKLLGIFDFFKIPNTAIGSVGDIKAPNNKQYIKEMLKLKSGASKYNSSAITKVEIRMPMVEKIAMEKLSFFSLFISI